MKRIQLSTTRGIACPESFEGKVNKNTTISDHVQFILLLLAQCDIKCIFNHHKHADPNVSELCRFSESYYI